MFMYACLLIYEIKLNTGRDNKILYFLFYTKRKVVNELSKRCQKGVIIDNFWVVKSCAFGAIMSMQNQNMPYKRYRTLVSRPMQITDPCGFNNYSKGTEALVTGSMWNK